MCFEPDARPPLPPVTGEAIDDRDLTLASRDGTQVAAHAARAVSPSAAGALIRAADRGQPESD